MKCCLERGPDFCSEHHVSTLHQDVWPRVFARTIVGTHRCNCEARGLFEAGATAARQVRGACCIPAALSHTGSDGVKDFVTSHVPDGAVPVVHRESSVSETLVSTGTNALPPSSRKIVKVRRRHATGRRSHQGSTVCLNAMLPAR